MEESVEFNLQEGLITLTGVDFDMFEEMHQKEKRTIQMLDESISQGCL